jgi:hypothetical protein
MGVDQADRESLQAAVRLTIARGDDLEFYFDTGWNASEPQRWEDILGEHSLLGRTVSKVVEFVESSPRINRVGMRGLMRGRIDFRTREALYRNGSGPWRVARGSEVLTASENGDTEGRPRGEPSPLDVIDALGAMEVEQRLTGQALGLRCALYEGQAYAAPGAGAQAGGPPKGWRTDRPLTGSVWVDEACLIRQIKITAMSSVVGHAVGTTMILALGSRTDADS